MGYLSNQTKDSHKFEWAMGVALLYPEERELFYYQITMCIQVMRCAEIQLNGNKEISRFWAIYKRAKSLVLGDLYATLPDRRKVPWAESDGR